MGNIVQVTKVARVESGCSPDDFYYRVVGVDEQGQQTEREVIDDEVMISKQTGVVISAILASKGIRNQEDLVGRLCD